MLAILPSGGQYTKSTGKDGTECGVPVNGSLGFIEIPGDPNGPRSISREIRLGDLPFTRKFNRHYKSHSGQTGTDLRATLTVSGSSRGPGKNPELTPGRVRAKALALEGLRTIFERALYPCASTYATLPLPALGPPGLAVQGVMLGIMGRLCSDFIVTFVFELHTFKDPPIPSIDRLAPVIPSERPKAKLPKCTAGREPPGICARTSMDVTRLAGAVARERAVAKAIAVTIGRETAALHRHERKAVRRRTSTLGSCPQPRVGPGGRDGSGSEDRGPDARGGDPPQAGHGRVEGGDQEDNEGAGAQGGPPQEAEAGAERSPATRARRLARCDRARRRLDEGGCTTASDSLRPWSPRRPPRSTPASASATSTSRSRRRSRPRFLRRRPRPRAAAALGPGRRFRLRRRLPPSHRAQLLAVEGRPAASAGYDRPLPLRDPLPDPLVAGRRPAPREGGWHSADRRLRPRGQRSALPQGPRRQWSGALLGPPQEEWPRGEGGEGVEMFTAPLDLHDLLAELDT